MMAFISFYTIVDGIFVSAYAPDQFPAINLVFPVITIANGIGFMFANGGCAIVAKLLGEHKKAEAKETFTFVLIGGLLVQTIFITFALIFKEQIFTLLNVEGEIYEAANVYYMTLILGSPLIFLEAYFHNFFIADGKPMLGLFLTIGAGATNILFDYIFVGVLSLEVLGAALATLLGYCVVAVPGLFYFLFKKKGLRFALPKLHFKHFVYAVYNGSSEFISNIANAIITLSYNIIMMNMLSQGLDGISAISAIQYVQFLFSSCFFGFAMGVAPIISYHYGEKNREYLNKCIKYSLIITTLMGVLMSVLAISFSSIIATLFAHDNQKIYGLIMQGLPIIGLSFLLSGINLFASNCYTALNDGGSSMIIAICRTFIFSVGFAFLFSFLFGSLGLWISLIATEVFSFIVVFIITLIKHLKNKKELIKPIEVN